MLELPALAQFAREAAPKGVRLLSINVKGAPALVRRLAARYDLPVLLDITGAVAERYDAQRQPYNVVITGSRISARFSGPTSHVSLLDSLRATTNTTGDPVVTEAGMDPRRKDAGLTREEGGWFDGWREVAASNEGRWTAQPDGVYVDPSSDRVFGVATVKGRPAEAFTLAEIHAQRALLLAAEPLCAKPSAQRRVEDGGDAANTPASGAACLCSLWDTFAHVDVRAHRVRVAVFPRSPLVRRADAIRVRQDANGARVFSPAVRAPQNLLPALRKMLFSDGRVLDDPLKPPPSS